MWEIALPNTPWIDDPGVERRKGEGRKGKWEYITQQQLTSFTSAYC